MTTLKTLIKRDYAALASLNERPAERIMDEQMLNKAVTRFLRNGGNIEVVPAHTEQPIPLRRNSPKEPRFTCLKEYDAFQEKQEQKRQVKLQKQEAMRLAHRLKLRERFAHLDDKTIRTILHYANGYWTPREIASQIKCTQAIIRAVCEYHDTNTPLTAAVAKGNRQRTAASQQAS